jgi:hypothetical protein
LTGRKRPVDKNAVQGHSACHEYIIVLEQTTGEDIDLGVCKAMLTIGTVKEILASAPEHTGLSCFREAV